MESADECSCTTGDIEAYESLRARALCGDGAGWRLGLAVLERQGVVAWLRLRESISTPAPIRVAGNGPIDNDALVGVLASMALACVAAR